MPDSCARPGCSTAGLAQDLLVETPRTPYGQDNKEAPLTTEPEETDDGFMGAEHFEGMGNVWSALLGEDQSFTDVLPTVISEGKTHPIRDNGGINVVLVQYPEENRVRAGVLLVTQPDNKNWEVWSAYPLFEGRPSALTIIQKHTWTNGVEGVVAAELAGRGAPISFFAPFYLRDFAGLAMESEKVVNLGALAFSLRQAEHQEYTIDKGPFFEDRLKAFLEEDPDKTESDFSAPIVSMKGAKVLLPAHYSCEWQFRFPVLAVEEVVFMEIKLYKLAVDFIGVDDEVISGYLYASEKILNGYVPLPGHEVEGVMWVTGSLADA